ncbi:hypothetical protein SLS62_003693 [Diatrype stigma]|uniref:Transcription factor domain-containing protein n=1 Tax=Diatrype stigma TaxID=117547 RepID=A0AAN9YUH5_9PEZI
MVRFIGSDSAGLPLKRKQVAQACSLCRKRKKRCVHGEVRQHAESDGTETVDNNEDQFPLQTQSQAVNEHSAPTSALSVKQDEVSNPERRVSRFVGDMNPEGLFIEATSPHSNRDQSIRGGVGIWQSHATDDKPYSTASAARQTSTLRQTMQGLLKAHVQNSCLPCQPSASDFAVLRRIYCEKLDPLFPAISSYLKRTPEEEITQIVLKQVISLAAASDPEAGPHLRLQNQDSLLGRGEFSALLSCAIRITLDAGFITDRFALTRILLVFSMYMQPTCPEEADLPARAFDDATHQMHTIGLHLAADENRDGFESLRTLFCCIWALDRITASLYGRAILLHERDIGWDLDASIAAQNPPFRLLLMVIGYLDKVFELYRPKNLLCQETMIIELPIFEQMIIDAGATKVRSAFLASLEILYHSVSILSCRLPLTAVATALPAPATNSRRSLSADRITSIVSQEFHDQLSYMPYITYGVSLSLSVAYQKLRYSNIPMYRNRGKQAFQRNTQILKSLGDTFWTAKVMAAMAEQVLQEMDKAVASLASQEPQSGDASKRTGLSSTRNGHAPGAELGSDTLTVPSNEGGTTPSFLGAIPDLDVFGHLDPTFDIGAVDAALEGNLDFGASSNWFDWQALWG